MSYCLSTGEFLTDLLTTFNVGVSSNNCQSFVNIPGPDLSGLGAGFIWSPKIFTSNSQSLVLFTFAPNETNGQPYYVTTNSTYTSWGEATEITGFSGNHFDFAFPKSIVNGNDQIILPDGETYYIWCVKQVVGIEVWSSSSLGGSYSSYLTGDVFGWVVEGEGPRCYLMSDRWRVYFDKISGGSTVGIYYTDWLLTNWTANGGSYELWGGGSSAWTEPVAIAPGANEANNGCVRQIE